jgi:hypothetical protein
VSLHNRPEHNTPEIVAALKAHGFRVGTPDIGADAFRLGRASAAPGWKPQRCAECDCEFGGADCSWIKSTRHNLEDLTDG